MSLFRRVALRSLMSVMSVSPLAAALDCSPVPSADRILRSGAVVLLGEIHGTAQAPDAVAQVTCRALERGLSVTVGLEIPVSESEALAAYVRSTDEAEPEALAVLLEGGFWQRDYQDGRASRAMVSLIQDLRRLRSATDRVNVVTIDDPDAPEGRDAYMARRVQSARAGAGENLILVLTGNLHNRLVRGTRWNAEHESMGYLLRARPTPDLFSLRVTHGGGSAWVCTGNAVADCGPRDLDGQDLPMGVELFSGAPVEAYSGRLHVGSITASPPAKNEPSLTAPARDESLPPSRIPLSSSRKRAASVFR